jgi:hypothetical protein
MTPLERAEKITKFFRVAFKDGDYWTDLTNEIAAQISEAEQEARESANMECLKCRRACSYYCRECNEGEAKASWIAGWNAAREKAKGIAEDLVTCKIAPSFQQVNWENCMRSLADRIAGMKSDVTPERREER